MKSRSTLILRTREEVQQCSEGFAQIAGVDEAGRGPLAGPVVAAAVILPQDHGIEGLADSKALSESKRDKLAVQIKQLALCYAIEEAQPDEIDAQNILQATMRAMHRALQRLTLTPQLALIDGNRCPQTMLRSYAVVKGDAIVPVISAASILAKTHRDALMMQAAQKYPHYGFEDHKGYPTPAHLAALEAHGPCAIHRKSFAPVRESLMKFGLQAESQTALIA